MTRLRWRERAVSSCLTVPTTTVPFTPQSPRLPAELCRKVISFTVRLAGATSIERDDPFGPPYSNEEYPEVDFQLFLDRRNLSLVCAAWYEVVTEISAEYIVIYSDKQLKMLVKKLDQTFLSKKLGERTHRVDFKILKNYNILNAVRLFRCTPNLMVYTNKNGPRNHPIRFTPIEVLKSLIANCKKTLRRVEWSGPGEPPRFQDLCLFCNQLPNLTTLRLMSIFSYPGPTDGAPPLIRLPSLKTLSLGVIPEPPQRRQSYSLTWDPFLRYLCVNSQQLPSLERFDCDLFPQLTMSFFDIHGHKLRMFRTSTCFADVFLPIAVAACPNLLDLVLVHGPELAAFPQYHPKLRRICIHPTIDVDVEVPTKIYDHAVITPLDTILKAIEELMASELVEVRIRNSGAFRNITSQKHWLNTWWRRWNLRRIQFVDKVGGSYQDPHGCTSPSTS